MNRKWMYLLMSATVMIWGLDYSVAKYALNTLDPLTLLFFKYAISLLMVFVILLVTKEKALLFRKQDIRLFIICAVVGEIAYFGAEYTAMSFMPVSLITIVLTFVPVVSILIERILYKRKPGKIIIIGVIVCIFGVSLIIGVDWQILFQGRIFGYLLAFSCVLSWNVYNFVTAFLHKRYATITLTFNQLTCTCLLLLPYVIYAAPPAAAFTQTLILELLYLGLASGSIGFIVTVRALHVLGPTTVALFSNFLPVTTTFFGFAVLGEKIVPLQFVGGAVVIAAGYVVIKELGKTTTFRTGFS